jgi:hypothetical protein
MKLIIPSDLRLHSPKQVSDLLTSFAREYRAHQPHFFCAAVVCRLFMEAVLEQRKPCNADILCLVSEMSLWSQFEYPKLQTQKN